MSTQPLLQRTAGKRIALPVRVEPKVFFANERTCEYARAHLQIKTGHGRTVVEVSRGVKNRTEGPRKGLGNSQFGRSAMQMKRGSGITQASREDGV